MVGNVAPGLGETFLRARQRRFCSLWPAVALDAHTRPRTHARKQAEQGRAAKAARNWGTYGLQAVHHPAADPASCSSSSGRLSIDRPVQENTSWTAKAAQVVAIA